MAHVNTDREHLERTMLLVLSGLPGTGKSELARGIGSRLRIPVLSVDPVESAILRAGIAPGFTTGLAAYLVVEALADSHLSLGQNVIIDAVNAVEPAKDMWRKLATRHSAALKIVECCCSDQALHRARLEARRRGLAVNFREPTWDDVQKRRIEYTPWAEPLLEVDAIASCESNVNRVLAWLNPEGTAAIVSG
jgi:predicted kinase